MLEKSLISKYSVLCHHFKTTTQPKTLMLNLALARDGTPHVMLGWKSSQQTGPAQTKVHCNNPKKWEVRLGKVLMLALQVSWHYHQSAHLTYLTKWCWIILTYLISFYISCFITLLLKTNQTGLNHNNIPMLSIVKILIPQDYVFI